MALFFALVCSHYYLEVVCFAVVFIAVLVGVPVCECELSWSS